MTKSSKKKQRRLAIEREMQRRYQEALDACPLSRADYERLVEQVSDRVVEHEVLCDDWRETAAYLEAQGHPVRETLDFLEAIHIPNDWWLLLEGDSCRHFGPTPTRAARMPLEKAELEALIDWVDLRVRDQGCDHSHRHARSWLREQGKPEARVAGALMALGGFCDCEVVLNVDPDDIYPRSQG